MHLLVSDAEAFVSDATAKAAVTDSIASLVGVVASQVLVTMRISRRLATPSHSKAAKWGESAVPSWPMWEDASTRALSATLSAVQITYLKSFAPCRQPPF